MAANNTNKCTKHQNIIIAAFYCIVDKHIWEIFNGLGNFYTVIFIKDILQRLFLP